MMFLVQQRAETLVANANKELAGLGEESEETEEEREERQREKRSVAEMIERIRKPARKDSRLEDYESKPNTTSYTSNPTPAPAPSAGGDIQMGGTETSAPRRPRTSRAIRKGLSRALKEVVDNSVNELEAYDRHCEVTTNVYRQALNRRMSRDGGLPLFTGETRTGGNGVPGLGGLPGGILRNGPSAVAGGVGGGILKNRNEQSPIDHNEIRRMSTGMPIVGASPTATKAQGQPARQYENIELLARRGSK
jgi:hypothetical protein